MELNDIENTNNLLTNNPTTTSATTKRIYMDPTQRESNLQLIPIYTDWANRYLIKFKLEPIRELTVELKDPKRLVYLINAITSDSIGSSPDNLLCSLNANSPVEILDKCLQYLARLGVNVSGIQSRELLNGELGTVLSLLYSLSHFKQKQKSLQFSSSNCGASKLSEGFDSFKQSPENISKIAAIALTTMPPNTGVATGSRLSTPLRNPQIVAAPTTTCSTFSSPSSSTSIKSPSSKLLAPSKISTNLTTNISSQVPIPSSSPYSLNSSSSSIPPPKVKPPSIPPPPSQLPSRLPGAASANNSVGITGGVSGSKLKSPGVKSIHQSSTTGLSSSNSKLVKSSNETSFSSAASTTSTYASIKSASSTSRSLKPPTRISTPTTASASSSRSNSQTKLLIAADNSNSKMMKLFGSSSKDKQQQKKAAAAEEMTAAMQNRSSSSSLLKPNNVGAQIGKSKIAGLKAPSALPTMASTSKLPGPGVSEKAQIQQQQQPSLRLPSTSGNSNIASSGIVKPMVVVASSSIGAPNSGLIKPSQLAPPSSTTNNKDKRFSKSSEESSDSGAYSFCASSSTTGGTGFGVVDSSSSSASINSFNHQQNKQPKKMMTGSTKTTTTTNINDDYSITPPPNTSSMHSSDFDDSGIHSDATTTTNNMSSIELSSHSPNIVDHKPVLAVKGIAVTKIQNSGLKPPISVSISNSTTPETQQQVTATTNTTTLAPNMPLIMAQAPTVGIVSPMRNQEKATTTAQDDLDLDEKSEIIEAAAAAVTMRNEANKKFEKKISLNEEDEELIPMKPLKLTEIPSLRNSRVSSTLETIPGGASDESLDSITTTIHCVKQLIVGGGSCQNSSGGNNHSQIESSSLNSNNRRSGYVSEGEALAFPEATTTNNPKDLNSKIHHHHHRNNTTNNCGGENNIGIYAKKMRSNFEVYQQHGINRNSKPSSKYDFNDSFEDSSSISSGISENFDDISTDDLTGSSLSDYPMTATTAQLPSSKSAAAGPSSSASSDYHSLTFQRNLNKLSNGTQSNKRKDQQHQQINNDQQRFINGNHHHQHMPQQQQAMSTSNNHRLYHTLVPKLALSDDGETLSISRNSNARSSLRYAPTSTNGRQLVNGYNQSVGPPQHSHYSNGIIAAATNSQSANNSPYHSHSLDRHGYLKVAFGENNSNSANTTPNSPYRLSLASQQSSNSSTSPKNGGGGMSSEGYSSGRQSVSARHDNHQKQQHRSSNGQRRSSSLSFASNAGMSKSMIMFESENNGSTTILFPLSTTNLNMAAAAAAAAATKDNGNGNYSAASSNGKHSPKLKRSQLKAIDIDFGGGSVPSSPARNNLQGSYSARSESSDVYANYSALQHQQQQPYHKFSSNNYGQIRSPLTKVPLVIPKTLPQGSSEMSLASSTGSCIGSEERYENEIRKLNYELENYRQTITKLTAKHENYNQVIHMFDSRLQLLVRHVNKLNQKSQLKEDEVEKLKSQIEYLRSLSSCATIPNMGGGSGGGSENGGGNFVVGKIIVDGQRRHDCSGSTDLHRHPSMESVASHRSSLSTSSKSSSRMMMDKNNGMSSSKNKKSWTTNMDNQIRSSFSRAFHKSKKGKNGSVSDVEQSPLHSLSLQPIAGSVNQLDELAANNGNPIELLNLKKELKTKEETLTDFRLDALDKAREVDILRETVARLASENKILKRNCTILAKRVDSRTSSRQSLSTCHDEDPVYDPLPGVIGGGVSNGNGNNCCSSSSHMSERSFSSTTSSSKRSSNGLSTRVCISLEPSGSLEFTQHQHELTIGSLIQPVSTTNWNDIDSQLIMMLKDYLHRIEIDTTLGIDCEKAIIGYRVGNDFIRNKTAPDLITPTQNPADIITPSTTIRIRLQGVQQNSVDGLIIESLFPKAILTLLIRLLEQSRRLVIHGARGIGKSNLAKTLAKYFSYKLAAKSNSIKPESIVDVRYPDDEKDKKFQTIQDNLQSLLKTGTSSIILIDNVHRKCIPHLLKAFKSADNSQDTPFVICTVNGALQRQVEEMQSVHGFRVFQLTNHMDAVKGFMGRYLRRRIAEAELTGQCRCGEQMQIIIDFLGKALIAINTFIEKANAHDETIGPRTFVQCPLSIEPSRDWFVRLWNENLVPYMMKAAREGMILGCRGQLKDPTEYIIEHWPWPDNGESSLLHHVAIGNVETGGEFDPMLALERIEENRKLQEHVHAH